jgi:hypothetical protein
MRVQVYASRDLAFGNWLLDIDVEKGWMRLWWLWTWAWYWRRAYGCRLFGFGFLRGMVRRTEQGKDGTA